jgi:DnaK suppressor protein
MRRAKIGPKRQQYFQELLQKKKEDLLVRVKEHERELDELQAEMPADDKDAAPWRSRQAELRGRIEEERAEIEMVMDAFELLKQGKYGLCVHCNEEIPIARLEILPFTQYCTKCQEMMEG